jgi:flagellin
MASIINTNLMSLNAQRNLSATQNSLATAVQRLSSGLRVNSAKDDAAGLAIAERMNTQIRGMNVAIRNANDGISLAQTAEAALGQVGEMAQRMRELAVQSANATNTDEDRANLDAEFQQLAEEITRTIASTTFNGLNILAGDAGEMAFQVGAGSDAAINAITIETTDLSGATEVTAVTGGSIASAADATTAMDDIDALIDLITTERATYGAAQNRFESVISNLQVAVESQTAARSRIMDADFAAETAAMTRAQVLQQAGVAMLSQANAMPNTVLSLLR